MKKTIMMLLLSFTMLTFLVACSGTTVISSDLSAPPTVTDADSKSTAPYIGYRRSCGSYEKYANLLTDGVQMLGVDGLINEMYYEKIPSEKERVYARSLFMAAESGDLQLLIPQYKGEPFPLGNGGIGLDLWPRGQYWIPLLFFDNRDLRMRIFIEYYDGVLDPEVATKIRTAKDYLEIVWEYPEDAEEVPVLLANGDTVSAVAFKDPYDKRALLIGYCQNGAFVTFRQGGSASEIAKLLCDYCMVNYKG